MRRSLVVAAVGALLTLGAAAPAASAPVGPDRFRDPVHLALGDSVPAGIGAVPMQSGYPERLVELLEGGYDPAADKATPYASADFQLVNLAVPGATTATLIDAQLTPALELIEERNGNRDPFDDVEVVTVTVSGNDVFGPAVEACIATETPAGCQAALETALAGVEERLATILGALVTAAGRDAEVVVTTYYNPIGSCVLSQVNPAAAEIADVGLESGSLPGVLTLSEGLNDVIRRVAAATGAQVTELYGELGPGQYVGDRDCLHPNEAGHAEIAELLYATLARGPGSHGRAD
ncbi:SGNH/GDSL hydrolase family protein [Geodermatophilus sp. SYSU D01176]